MKHRMIATLALVAASSLFAFANPTLAAWEPTFKSEQQITVDAADKALRYLQEDYGLPAGFTASQYGAAKAEREIQWLRKDYSLGTNFTSDELAANYGAKRVADLMKDYKLPTNFTSDQLRAAKAQANAKWSFGHHAGLAFPFSYADYQRVAGAEEVARYATDYRLPTAWVYPDLVAAAGPERASEIRHRAGFARDATHNEIVLAFGRMKADWYVKDNKLPAGFSAAELASLKSYSHWEYTEYADLAEPFSDADLVAFFGKRKIADVSKNHNLPAKFTEADLRKAIADAAIASMQARYDLDANFTEADVRRAAGLSAAAEARHDYKLRPDFTAAEYEAAYKKRISSHPADWMYTY